MKVLWVKFLRPVQFDRRSFDVYESAPGISLTVSDGFVRMEAEESVTYVPVHMVHQMRVDESTGKKAKK